MADQADELRKMMSGKPGLLRTVDTLSCAVLSMGEDIIRVTSERDEARAKAQELESRISEAVQSLKQVKDGLLLLMKVR